MTSLRSLLTRVCKQQRRPIGATQTHAGDRLIDVRRMNPPLHRRLPLGAGEATTCADDCELAAGRAVVLLGSRLKRRCPCDWFGTVPFVQRTLSQGSGATAVVTMIVWFNVWSEG